MVMLKTMHVVVAVRAYQPQALATKLSQNPMQERYSYAALQCLLSVNGSVVPTTENYVLRYLKMRPCMSGFFAVQGENHVNSNLHGQNAQTATPCFKECVKNSTK